MRVVKKVAAVPENEQQPKVPAVRPLRPFEEMDRMFASLFPRGWMLPFAWERSPLAEAGIGPQARLPRVDVIDRDTEVVVRAEAPGVRKDRAGSLPHRKHVHHQGPDSPRGTRRATGRRRTRASSG